ncbi:endonuclease I family protein [Bacteriovorax sp. DB6_IX]|uniref:endonuclease I family protein n=1 Tax=Bacteriovorax sp. DB6_IX TaxID=1353530 RepID=UPI00038A3B43|nr:endonuclease [Bacteriovorax sp. DB6_IX]EQC51356.1 nuclease, EndA/NucM family [Bacteriovorax sp. DB6_IX]
MNKLLLTALLLVSFTTAAGELHHYYPSKVKTLMTNANGEALKSYLFAVLNSTHQMNKSGQDTLGCENSGGKCYNQKSLGYKGARKVLFGNLHLEKDADGYYIKDVYCRKEFRRRHTRMGPGQIPNSNVVNCEHTWPQSKFSSRFNKGMQKSDLHHLFPTDSHANSIRGNHNFGDGGSTVDSDCTASYSSGSKFEVPDEHKGNVARAMFYFSTRYQKQLDRNHEETLRRWHLQDPVDAAERERNDMIFNVQQNRNPFIDMPELVDMITDF